MLVSNEVRSSVEINVDFKVLKDFLNVVKGFGDSNNVINFNSDGIRSTDGYSAHWVKVENLTNISINVSRSVLVQQVIEMTKLGKKLESILDNDLQDMLNRLKKVKEGNVKIVVEPSDKVKEENNIVSRYSNKREITKTPQDKVTVFVNGDLMGAWYQDIELKFPDLDRVMEGMNFENLISLSEFSKKALITKLKELKKELKPKLFNDYVLDINTSRSGLKITPVLRDKYMNYNSKDVYMETFFIDCLNNTDVEFTINASKLLNYLVNMTSKTVEIEFNEMNTYNWALKIDEKMLNCAKFNDNTIIMLCRK